MSEAEKRHIKWAQAKQELMKDFQLWIEECSHTRENNPKDMIEFMYQKGFIKGKKWREYINQIAERNRFGFFIHYEMLEEGKLPPDVWV